jgi:hypothetical protein
MIVEIIGSFVLFFFPLRIICRRAGLHWSAAYAVLVPGAGLLAILLLLAFSEGPALRDVHAQQGEG